MLLFAFFRFHLIRHGMWKSKNDSGIISNMLEMVTNGQISISRDGLIFLKIISA